MFSIYCLRLFIEIWCTLLAPIQFKIQGKAQQSILTEIIINRNWLIKVNPGVKYFCPDRGIAAQSPSSLPDALNMATIKGKKQKWHTNNPFSVWKIFQKSKDCIWRELAIFYHQRTDYILSPIMIDGNVRRSRFMFLGETRREAKSTPLSEWESVYGQKIVQVWQVILSSKSGYSFKGSTIFRPVQVCPDHVCLMYKFAQSSSKFA